MPGYLSHYLFSIGTARRLQDSKAYPVLVKHKKALCLGGEGPDILFYYFPTHIRENPSLGHRLHKYETRAFLASGIKNVTSKKDHPDKELLYAYLSGLICHYTLDTIAHPYVMAFANPLKDKMKKPLSTYQHCNLETAIDTNLLFKYLNKFPSEQDYLSITKPSSKERRLIAAFLSSTCNKVYGKESDFSLTTPAQMYRAVTLFPYVATYLKDKTGIKKPILKTLEKVLHVPYRPSCIMSSDDLHMNLDILNLEHQPWSSPFDPDTIHQESFIDLFKKGIDSAYKRCQMLYSIVFESENAMEQKVLTQILLDDLGNLSYNTGLPL